MKKPECPDVFNYKFGIELIEYLGGDTSKIKTSWCWEEFGGAYPELIPGAKKYFEDATTGDPAGAAYNMAVKKLSTPKWAERVIENTTVGDPERAVYWIVYDRLSTPEWAERVKNKFELRENNNEKA